MLKFMMKFCSAADLLCFLKAAPSESDPVMCTVILPQASARSKGFAVKAEVVKCGEMQPPGLDIPSLSLSNLIFVVARCHLLKQKTENYFL